MPYSHFAYNNLMREGLRKDRTFITGSPMLEVINAHRQQIEDSDILEKLHLEKGKYMVMSAHREENVDIPEKFNRLYPALNKIADEYKMPVIFSVHPRTQKQFDAKGFKLSKYIQDDKPFGFFEYCKLQENAFCVLSDSGTLTEESSIFDFPAVLIRTSTERQEGVIHGSIVIGGVDYETIKPALERARKIHRPGNGMPIVPDYSTIVISEKVTEFIKKYANVIRNETWDSR
jgi:UDP-N-acetylglucosamine 2-epimerase